MELFTIEFWVAFQMCIDLVLVVFILGFLKNSKSGVRSEVSREAADQIIAMLEPLLKEADLTAKTFAKQLKEKNRLIGELNERLDSRIISLNLLLNRSEVYLSAETEKNPYDRNHVYDQQEAILELNKEGYSAETIAQKLFMPKGEVDLVLDLKKKFLEMK